MGPAWTTEATARMAAVVLVVATGCGGPDTGSSPPPPDGVRVLQGSAFEQLEIRWEPPQSAVDGFEVQGRLAGGTWESLGATLPANATGAIVQLSSTLPEVVTFNFRVRAVRGRAVGDWSPEATFGRGPRWPTGATTAVVPSGIQISWVNASLVATSVRVYRRGPTAPDPDLLLAELPATTSSFTDPGPFTANAGVGYGLAAVAGDAESVRADAWSPGYPIAPVANLTATNEPGGIRLRWQRPPLLGQTFVVHRTQGLAPGTFSNPVTPAPVDADEYLDAPPFAGGFDYAVETWIGGAPANARAQVPAFAPPAGPPAFDAAILILPDAVDAARDSAGRLAFAIGVPTSGAAVPLQVTFSGVGAPGDHELGNGIAWSTPAVAFDPQDRPHALFLGDPGSSGLAPLIHVWYDGSVWQEEELVRRAFVNPLVRFAIDAAGGLHAAWSALGPPPVAEYARRGPTGWTIEDLGSAIALPATLVGLAADGTGAVAVLARDTALPRLLLRDPAGWTWTSSTLPDRQAELAPLDTGWELLSLDITNSPGNPQLALLVQPWTASGPGPEEVAYRWVSTEPIRTFGFVARTVPDRQLAWVAEAIPRLSLAVRTGGTWSQQIVYEGCLLVLPRLDAAGNAAVLCETSDQPYPANGDRFWVELTER